MTFWRPWGWGGLCTALAGAGEYSPNHAGANLRVAVSGHTNDAVLRHID